MHTHTHTHILGNTHMQIQEKQRHSYHRNFYFPTLMTPTVLLSTHLRPQGFGAQFWPDREHYTPNTHTHTHTHARTALSSSALISLQASEFMAPWDHAAKHSSHTCMHQQLLPHHTLLMQAPLPNSIDQAWSHASHYYDYI